MAELATARLSLAELAINSSELGLAWLASDTLGCGQLSLWLLLIDSLGSIELTINSAEVGSLQNTQPLVIWAWLRLIDSAEVLQFTQLRFVDHKTRLRSAELAIHLAEVSWVSIHSTEIG